MSKTVFLIFLAAVMVSGCASHQPDPNAVMMDNVIGELDRETAR